MINDNPNEIIYSINVEDIQEVAQEILERDLTKEELMLVEESVGDYIDWFQAIETSIYKHIAIGKESSD